MDRSLLSYRLEGHALFFVLVISILIAIITSSILLISHYNRLFHVSADMAMELERNAKSGMALLLSEKPPVGEGESQEIDLFQEGLDSVELVRQPWGAYEVVVSRSHRNEEEVTRAALLGNRAGDSEDLALYMVDQNRPLRISGKTELRGRCKLPKAGVQSDYVEGLSYSGSKFVYGAVGRSTNKMPDVDADLLIGIQDPEKFLREQETVDWSSIQDQEEIRRSFSEPTLVITGQDITLNKLIQGNVIIHASRSIAVKNNAVLKDVLLKAPFIEVEDGTSGSAQFVVEDSLHLGNHVELSYPSAISLVKPSNNQQQAVIVIGEESHIYGSVLALQKQYDRTRTLIKLPPSSVVTGLVYADGNFELGGKVEGTVLVRTFSRRSNSGSSQNLLVNAVIDRPARSDHFVGSAIVGLNGEKGVAKWLE